MRVRDFEDDLLSAMAKFVVAAFLILILAVLAGCTPTVKHEAPQLDQAAEAIKKIVVEGCKPTQRVILDMPPLPDKAHISIDGTTLKADEGGIAILRAYVKAREMLKP